jgi:hypothetical protein
MILVKQNVVEGARNRKGMTKTGIDKAPLVIFER